MSDFDEEAEREKLRKRFAEDEKEREATQRMSELLLQGATMTDTHCENCGDPLFRYDGRTFCSTCQRAAGEDPARTESGATESPDGTRTNEATPPDETAPSESQRIAVEDPHTASNMDDERATGGTNVPPERAHTESTTPHARRTPPSQSGGSVGSRTENGGSLAETEASLARTLHRQANAAEGTDDLNRTREHLAAAREAAEALAAVRQAGR